MRYSLHGYLVESTTPLELPPATSAVEGSTNLSLTTGSPRNVPMDGPPGELIAELVDDHRRNYYRFVRTDAGLLFRFHGTADFVTEATPDRLTVHLDPAANPALVSVLVGGPVIAARLMLDGHLVLHASAVDVGGTAINFVGMSGMGKSTIASLGLTAGFTPLTDDVLRVDVRPGEPPLAWPGSTELRLRDSAKSLALDSTRPWRVTADGRTAVSTGAALRQPVPLACCVIPIPQRESADISVKALDPFSALRRLLSFPRIVGWQDPTTLALQLRQLTTLVGSVPVIEARLPWGPPFSGRLFRDLLHAVEVELQRPLSGPQPTP